MGVYAARLVRCASLFFILDLITNTVSGRETSPLAAPSLLWANVLDQNVTFSDPCLLSVRFPSEKQQLAAALAVMTWDHTATTTQIVVLSLSHGTVLWRRRFETQLQPYSGWCVPGRPEGALLNAGDFLFCGATWGVAAFDPSSDPSSPPAWEYRTDAGGGSGVPAHPTFMDGRIYFTFENGHRSSPMFVLNATTGALLYSSGDERAFTLIWPVQAAMAVAYCGYHPADRNAVHDAAVDNPNITLTVRDATTGSILWQKHGLRSSNPGMWDNPNLDVDATGETILMYSKPHAQLRLMNAFLSRSGRELDWQVTSRGSVADYDTYAYEGHFYRLVTVDPMSMAVEKYSLFDNSSIWSETFLNADNGSILLVGSGCAFSFELNGGVVTAFDARDGTTLWSIVDVTLPSTGITSVLQAPHPGGGDSARVSVLFFGHSNGTFTAAVCRSV